LMRMRIRDPGIFWPWIRDSGSGIQDPGFRIRDLGSGIWD
jgi:hypothetical protein